MVSKIFWISCWVIGLSLIGFYAYRWFFGFAGYDCFTADGIHVDCDNENTEYKVKIHNDATCEQHCDLLLRNNSYYSKWKAKCSCWID